VAQFHGLDNLHTSAAYAVRPWEYADTCTSDSEARLGNHNLVGRLRGPGLCVYNTIIQYTI